MVAGVRQVPTDVASQLQSDALRSAILPSFFVMDGQYTTYGRVSTDRQGGSGLAIEAQRVAVECFLNSGNWKLLGEFVGRERQE